MPKYNCIYACLYDPSMVTIVDECFGILSIVWTTQVPLSFFTANRLKYSLEN